MTALVSHISVCAFVVGLLAGTAAGVKIETVPVGHRGNAGELSGAGAPGGSGPDRICGTVDYTYSIGKFEVTAWQYTAFLNAVAATDTYGLYNERMDINSGLTNAQYGCDIKRHGTSGGYTYWVGAEQAHRPVNFVSWGDAARFANWLHNGQLTGPQDPSTTEDGAYTLNGAVTNAEFMAVNRNSNWKWAITSEDEWYKAAYHKNDGVTGNYWLYPTSSDSLPSNQLVSPDPGNSANFYQGDYTIGDPYWRTEVGAFTNSASPYGTFDQGGNVWEWNEAVIGAYRGLRGGSFYQLSVDGNLHAAARTYCLPWSCGNLPTHESGNLGFRVSKSPVTALWLSDFDSDNHVDLADFEAFLACFDGPNRLPAIGCAADADIDDDGDVDLTDFAVFAACFNGATRPPSCPGSYGLQVTVKGGGGVSLGPDGGLHEDGTVVTLTAESAEGWVFAGWGDDLVGCDNPTTVFMDTHKVVTALFVERMVLIPAGEFQMGNTFSNEGSSWEQPVHAVWVDAFYMDRYEVTSELWDVVRVWATANGYDLDGVGWGKAADHPASYVNWYDCVKWCNARSQMEGRTPCYYTDAALTVVYGSGELEPYVKWDANGYRLPTEAEWEKAARGGSSGRRFPWSDSDFIRHARANYRSSWRDGAPYWPYDASSTEGYHPLWGFSPSPYTSPVGFFDGSMRYKAVSGWPHSAASYQTVDGANGYGLYDMTGNVLEWCHDWYGETYYRSSPYENPRGPESGIRRIHRGGAYADSAVSCRVACRFDYGGPSGRRRDGGFRLALGAP